MKISDKDRFTSVSISKEAHQLLLEIIGHYQQTTPTPGAKFPIRAILGQLIENEHSKIKRLSVDIGEGAVYTE